MRPHPKALDLLNRHRRWFRTLNEYTCDGELTWEEYREWYFDARDKFNALAYDDLDRAFRETYWCLLRQPFYHRNSRWPHVLKHLEGGWGALLDYGCGTGEMLAWLKAKNPAWLYDGEDVPSPQQEYAMWRGFHPPKWQHKYDVIVCYETLEHLNNPVEHVTKMLDYLQPGGVLLWDFVDAFGGGNIATDDSRREVLRMLRGTTGQREIYVR